MEKFLKTTRIGVDILSEQRLIIFSWLIPNGGMAKVILKEYYYYKKFIKLVTLLTLEPLPESYFVELEKTKIKVCGMSKKVKHSKKTDFSKLFPGVNIYSHHSILKNMKSLIACLKINKPTRIVAHSLFSAFFLMPFCTLWRVPYIIILHDNPFLFTESNKNKVKFGKKIFYMIVMALCNFVIFRSRSTICTTSRIKKAVESKLVFWKNLTVADYGIDYFPIVSSENRSCLLTVSKWSDFRKPWVYLKVLQMLPDKIKLIMAGRWDSYKDIKVFQETISNFGLENRVTLLSNLSDDDLNYLYDTCRVFLRLGFNEIGTGQGIIEALGHGCPVVISKSLGAADIVRDGVEGYLVDENNLDEIAGAITKIYNSDELVGKMSQASYNLARQNDWSKYLNKVLQSIFI